MGNTVPPRMCRDAAGTAAVVGRSKAAAAPPAAPRRVAVAARGSRPRPADGVAVGGGAVVTTTVKIVLKRKDAEELVARLHAQSARERKARMDELKCGLRGAARDGGDGASPAASPCRGGAWRPMLAPIKEN